MYLGRCCELSKASVGSLDQAHRAGSCSGTLVGKGILKGVLLDIWAVVSGLSEVGIAGYSKAAPVGNMELVLDKDTPGGQKKVSIL